VALGNMQSGAAGWKILIDRSYSSAMIRSFRAIPVLLVTFLTAHSALEAQQPALLTPAAGLVITSSARLRPGTYRLDAPASLDSALIVIRGDDVTVDMSGVTLAGSDSDADPDAARGVAVRIEGGRNVRVANARIRGYKVGILARATRGLVLIGNDLSHNWKPRLYSLVEHESLADWLSYHHNEQSEWLRYGAAIYLDGVRRGEVRENIARQGMNGLLMMRTDSVRVIGNDFSFDSGLGIGLYRSSDNVIMHNRADFDVRGYSHGFYRRGQDSAALLIYEQSCRNVVAFNSMTHGGDGLFLWAGQQTMDTGAGGANDNLFYANDFSYAPTNGMEATFSRNAFVGNLIRGSDHGLWGGYSYESQVVANRFAGNRIGIAIEHGQDDIIRDNTFGGDSTAISLWANPIEPSDWGYPKHRDTRSRSYIISGNVFTGNRVALRALNTMGLTFRENSLTAVDTAVVARDTVGVALLENREQRARGDVGLVRAPELVADWRGRLPAPIEGAAEVRGSGVATLPRSAIIVDEWGPYDWRSPKLWPADGSRGAVVRLQVLGPVGRWRVVSVEGARLDRRTGTVPDTIAVTPARGRAGDWSVTLEYRGAPTISPRGELKTAGSPVRFSYERFEPTIDWHARFWTWSDSASDLRRAEVPFSRVASSTPVLDTLMPRLDLEWYRPTIRALPQERFAMEAVGEVSLGAGATYSLRAISDDGIRVWVDESLAIDHWVPHESAVDTVTLSPGRHRIRVEYYQVDSWTELRVEIVRRR
jgi:nitrous oxidase accessory protein NosD